MILQGFNLILNEILKTEEDGGMKSSSVFYFIYKEIRIDREYRR
jgi:hypothetical protein